MIRKAHMRDVKAIQALVNAFADAGRMLPVSLVDLYDRLRDFFVWEEDGRVLGVLALHFTWEGLAEVRSLAVADEAQGRGIARALVERGLEEARQYDCTRVFALTYVPDFFRKLGFRDIEKGELPHKVWADCVKCPKFPDCDEVAVAVDLD
ncbi:MAG: N-acetyltransferase [Planctomycetota bacterium]